jgi:hypothetical protein
VEVRRIVIALRQIALAVRLVETRWPTDRPAPGNRLAGRAATWPATEVMLVSATEAVRIRATAVVVWAATAVVEIWAAGLRAEPTASVAEISHVAAAETAMPSEEGTEGDSVDRMPAPIAPAELPAWDLAVVA